MKSLPQVLCAAFLAVAFIPASQGQEQRRRERLPAIDARRVHDAAPAEDAADARAADAAAMKGQVPQAKVDWHGVTGAPKFVHSPEGFLTGPDGAGRGVSAATAKAVSAKDSLRPLKTFLTEHRALFGHGPEALEAAPKKHDYTDPHNGLRTVTWQQTVDEIPVFEALLKAHITAKGELVNIGSGWVRDGAAAAEAGTPNRAALAAAPRKTASEALAIAGSSVDAGLDTHQIGRAGDAVGANQRQAMAAVGLSDATAELVWLPLDENSMRLCWQTVFSHNARGEMYLALVDVETGELLLRRPLTNDLSDATYRVFTSDSPSPFSPGLATPGSTQPAQVSRTLVTTPALNTTASPNGWIDDGVNETRGNNVDAHTDTNADNVADLPRPQGSNRVFDFTLDLTQAPSTYKDAAVTQLFYWCNFMHDKLYALGFTEAAGNFQNNNFGKGGLGNDAVQADAQDGSGTENANFSTPPDGSAGRMQMYLFTGPAPDRDGDFDADIILHEYTHGLTNRLVGAGVGISALQPSGMGEGWSDFYGLTLLSEAGDNVNGNYATGGYATYLLDGSFNQNYYYGIRRYPYSTNLSINPLTFKDIDPTKASAHAGIPRSSVIGNTANEVHNMGEVWCVTLWEVRAGLVTKHGWATGNQLTLQLVTDGLKLAPANPTFLQARDAIIQADLVLTGGANKSELWTAFAKRGMGASAIAPASSTATGVTEAFDVPDTLNVTPQTSLSSTGQSGGPFSPTTQTYTLTNNSAAPLNWTASKTQAWVTLSATSGALGAGVSTTVIVTINATAATLPAGSYADTVTFLNTTTGLSQQRSIALTVSPPRIFYFPLDTTPGWTMTGQWAFGHPTGGGGLSYGYPDPANGYTGTNVLGVNLSGDYSTTIGGPYYVTSGPLNLTGVTSTKLQFQRWLNADYQPFVYATIEVSSNGTTWTQIWNNGSSTVADNAWTKVTYDISSLADNKATVYLRWGYQVGSSGAYPYSGWNIDDIEILGTPANELTLTLPATIREGDAAATGTIAASAAPTSNLTVTLTASAPAYLSVPATVVIPAGSTSATFAVSAVNDSLLNGSRSVSVTPGAAGWVPHGASITVTDNESATLSVTLPATASEAAGAVSGTVNVSAAAGVPITVQLVSSNTAEATVPATVTIPAGQTSVGFTLTPINDSRIDGTQAVTVTASVDNWVAGSATINITDNESTALTVIAPATVREGDTGKTGTVNIGGTLTANLTVALSSSKTGDLTVPASVVIPAGQTSASFALTVIDDALLDGTQTAVITATATGFTAGQASVAVQDNDAHHYDFGPIASQQGRGIAIPVTLTARDASNAPITNYTGSVTFSATSSVGPLAVSPGSASGFVNGVWTGSVTISSFATNVQLIATDSSGHTGTSNAFTVSTGTLDHFGWANVPAAQTMDNPFAVAITAQDAGNNTITDFNGAANLNVLSSITGTPTGVGTFYWDLPFYGYYAKSRVQSIYLASELGGPGRLTGVAVNVLSPTSGQTFAVNIRMKHTTALVATNSWDATGWTLVHQSTITPSSSGWMTFNFSMPFDYDGTSNLLFDISIDNTVNGSYYATVAGSTTSTARTTYGYTSTTTSSPLTWSGTSGAYPYTDTVLANLRFNVEKTLPLRPGSVAFSNGIAATQVSVPFTTTGARLKATDSAGHTGLSNTFSVGAPAPPPTGSGTIFLDNFETGTLGPAWTVTGTGTYRTQVTSASVPHAGSYHLTMDNSAGDGNYYARNEATLTLNLAGRSGVTLSFWAKMFDDDPHAPLTNPFTGGADFDGVAISADGNTWYEVQSLRSPTISNTYAQFTVNLDNAIASRGLTYNSAFKIRFNQYDNYPISTDGIAIDDVLVTGTPLTSITFTVPAQVTEGAGAVSGTVTLPAAQASDVTVSLGSNSPAKISVPATVIVPAGQTSASFTLTVLDDALLDGLKTVGLSASAAGLYPGAAYIQVLDNETSTISLTAPATMVENATAVQGTLTLGQPAVGAVTIALSSSDPTALQVPATVVFAAGQTVASFTITPVDDTKIDGTQTATITASYPGWTSATAQVAVTDNESRAFTISGTTYVNEGVSTTRTLSLGGTYASDLTVTLVSSNPARLAVPASVTIPAGSLGVVFNDLAVENTAFDGTGSATITASAPTFTTSTLGVTIYDNDVQSFSFGSIATQKSGVAFYVSISALSGSSTTYGFNGPVTLGTTGSSGVTVTPATITMSSGQWSGYVTCNGVGSAVKLTGVAGSATGSSAAFVLSGSPKIGVAPASVSASVQQGSTTAVPVTISNTGAATLTWNIASTASVQGEVVSEGRTFAGAAEVPKEEALAPAATVEGPAEAGAVYTEERAAEPLVDSATAYPLATALANLNLAYNTVRAAIPNRYAFTEGVTGTNINDGGSDMYDGGNYLNTNLASSLAYSDGVITPHSGLGTGGQYFTRKFDGLWIFAADVNALGYFETAGNLGADSGGSTDTAVLSLVRDGITYRGFVKRVYAAGDPSVNHLMIVADNGVATHAAATDTNDDYHRLSNLTGVSRIYYLLYAGTAGAYIDNTSTLGIMSAFLDALSGTDWLTVSPTSGTLAAGASQTMTLGLGAVTLGQGAYVRNLSISSNDPATPTVTLPVTLTVQGEGILQVTPASSAAVTGVRGGPFTPASQVFTLSNGGGKPLAWSASKTGAWHDLDLAGGTLNPGQSVAVTAAMNAAANQLVGGSYSSTISFTNTTTGLGNATRALALTVTPAAELSVTPADDFNSASMYPGAAVPASRAYVLKNIGDATLSWTASDNASWLSLNTTAGSLAAGASVTVTAGISASGVLPGTYIGAMSFGNTTNARGNATRLVNFKVGLPAPVLQPEPAITPATTNTIAWSGTAGAAGYEAQCATDPDFTNPLESPLLLFPGYTFTGLADSTQYYYRVRARRPQAAQSGSFTQTLQTQFTLNSLTNVSATAVSGSVVLSTVAATTTTPTEKFDEATSDFGDTAFPDAPSGFTREVATAGPSTTPPLPVNTGTDMVVRGSGGPGFALRDATISANVFSTGLIDGYLAPRDRTATQDAGFVIRAARNASGVNGYAAVLRFYPDGTVKPDLARVVNSSYASGGFNITPYAFTIGANENVRARLSVSGTQISLSLWRVSLVGGVVTESPIAIGQYGETTLSVIDSTYTNGVPGLLQNGPASTSMLFDDVTYTQPVPAGYQTSGTMLSTLISSTPFARWGVLTFSKVVTDPGTSLTVDVLNASGGLLAADVASGTDLNTLGAVAGQTSLRLRANFLTANPLYTPRLDDWTLQYVTIADGVVYSAYSPTETSYQFNAPPGITAVSDQVILEDGQTGLLPFSLSDDSTPVAQLVFSVSSSNPTVVPPGGLAVLGTGADRTIQVTPARDQFGGSVISIQATDEGGKTTVRTFAVLVKPVNDGPVFARGSDLVLAENAGPQILAGWASGISAGPANEGSQRLNFIVTTDNAALFSVPPAIAADGTLSFVPAVHANGAATVTVRLHDDGGTADGGVDTSAAQSFTISVAAVNDAPAFTKGADVTVREDAGPQVMAGWITQMSAGPADEAAQALDFIVTNDNAALFAAPPAIQADGTLRFTPASDANGSANVTVRLHDSGGSENGGSDMSAPQSFTISVTAVNDAPQFAAGGSLETPRSAGPQTVPHWATRMSAGPGDEAGQALDFRVTVDDATLFAAPPALTADGTLTYTPAPLASGTATVSVRLHDDGGTENGGVDLSEPQSFTIAVTTFTEEAGTYNGLVTAAPETSPLAASAGLIRITLRSDGTFTGKLTLGGVSTALKGSVDEAGVAHFGKANSPALSIPRAAGASPLALSFKVDVARGSDSLAGAIQADGADFCVFTADRAVFATAAPGQPAPLTLPAEMAGAYTFMISARPPDQQSIAPVETPLGYGCGTLNVSAAGKVRLAGQLADGTAFSYSNDLSKHYGTPFYQGSRNGYALAGPLGFRDLPGVSDFNSEGLLWFRNARRTGMYRAGWPQGLQADLFGSRFTSKPGTALLNGLFPGRPGGNAMLHLTDGGLVDPGLSTALTIETSYRVIVPGQNSNALGLHIDPLTGLFTGKFTPPGAHRSAPFRGVLLQKQNLGVGAFRTPKATGEVTLAPQ